MAGGLVRLKVKESLAIARTFFRLWYTDRALHGDISIEDDPTRTVGYLGILHQALLDLKKSV